MTKIEAPTLQLAYTKATEELGCSITDLDFEILQNSSGGFLGFFKKNAIIVATCKTPKNANSRNKQDTKKINMERKTNNRQEYKKSIDIKPTTKEKTTIIEPEENKIATSFKEKDKITSNIVDNFNANNDTHQIIEDIEYELKELFKHICYDIEVVEVSFYDDKTIKIRFDGNDAALLIGKEGYRYKALSYMLFNWINPKYNLLLRLEIAEFLQNQENQIKKYLEPLKSNIDKNGRGQTKPLDGVLVQIALKELRASFPSKYVAIRNNSLGEKYIIVNEFSNKQ